MRPDRHGVMDLVTHLRDTVPNVVTLPQRFREAGYLSVGYGKIFHQNLDDALSWSSQAEFPDANHSYRGLRGAAWVRAGGWRRGWRYDQYRLPANVKAQRTRDRAQPLYSVVPPYESGPADDPQGRGTTDAHIASSAIAALRRLRAQSKPWLLAVGFVRPHLPFNAPAAFFAAATPPPRVAPPRPPTGLSRLTRAHLGGGNGELWSFKGAKQLAQREPRQLRRAYAACVSFVDSQVGRVVSALGSGARVQRRSVVVLLSDHGWKLSHHGAWGKHTLMSADTRVPLLLHVPWLPASHGRSVDLPVELLDLYPTLLELANLPPPPTLSPDSRTHTRTHARTRKAPHSRTASGRRLGRADDQGRRLAPGFRSPGSHLAARARSRRGARASRVANVSRSSPSSWKARASGRRRAALGNTVGNVTAAPRRARPPQLDGRSLLPLLSGGGEGGGVAAARAAAWRATAFALSQWGDHRSEGCMGYALRVPGWTLMQWVLSPQHRSAGPLAGGSAAARRAARRQAPSQVQLADAARCAASADLFRLPLNGSTDEMERRSTSDFPRTTRRLRMSLRAELQLPGWVLPNHRVARGEMARGEMARGEAEGGERSQGARRRSRAAADAPVEPGAVGRSRRNTTRTRAAARTRHGKHRREEKVQVVRGKKVVGLPRGQKGLRGKRRCVYGTVPVPCD